MFHCNEIDYLLPNDFVYRHRIPKIRHLIATANIFFGTGTLIHTRHQGYDDGETNA